VNRARLARGEIWEFALDPRRGREQQGTRPCLVVSTDVMNRSAFPMAVVCPITTRSRPSFRWRPGLVPEDLEVVDPDWTPRPNWVEIDQILAVDLSERIKRHLATVVTESKLAAVDISLRMMLSL